MTSQTGREREELIQKFPSIEKSLARIGFYGYILIGVYGIYLYSVLWTILYIGFVALGFVFVVMFCLCSHCPYPYEYSDCLFLRYRLITRLFQYRPRPMSFLEKVGLVGVFAGSVLIPQYWLFKTPLLLVFFWIFCLSTAVAFPLYYCRRCVHFRCPFNMVGPEVRKRWYQNHGNISSRNQGR